MIAPFDWKKLTPLAALEHRLDEHGRILLRLGDVAPPFMTIRAFDGKGGFTHRSLSDLGYTWHREGDGWALRSSSMPLGKVEALWGPLAKELAGAADIDDRLVVVTIACEAGSHALRADPSGLVKAPRTERGYPDRTGENDFGDFDRDLRDWHGSRGSHSSHGLMQTLIATATSVRPDLFAGVDPSRYRTVLWEPRHSIACGVATMKSLTHARPATLTDPLAMRVGYASGPGGLRPLAGRWGVAILFDENILCRFIAYWNELACARSGVGCTTSPPTVMLPSARPASRASSSSSSSTTNTLWLVGAFGCFALTVAATIAARHFTRRSA